jgi:hypothetical protein
MTTSSLRVGSRVRFQASLSNGGTARWMAVVVRIKDGVASVRHPQQARCFPFSPVPEDALYRYPVSALKEAR